MVVSGVVVSSGGRWRWEVVVGSGSWVVEGGGSGSVRASGDVCERM